MTLRRAQSLRPDFPMLKALLSSQENRWRVARFLIVGGTAYGVQVATMKLFLLSAETNVAFTLSFMCSTSSHYLLNRFWALPSFRTDAWRQAREYLGTAVLSWVINFMLFRLCLDVFGFGKIASTAIAVPPSTVMVFLLLNFRVFRAKQTEN